MAKNRPAATPKSGFSASRDIRRLIPCGNGTAAYLTAGPKTLHRAVAELPATIDAWLDQAGDGEAALLLAEATALAAAYPQAGWDAVVAHLTAGDEAA